MLPAMRVVVDTHERRSGEERVAESGVDRDLAERRAKRACFPERDAALRIADARVIRRQDDDKSRDGYASKYGCGRWPGVHVTCVRRNDAARGLTPWPPLRVRRGGTTSICQEGSDGGQEVGGIDGVDPANARGGR